MKTHRNLWPQLVDWNNLLASYRACRRRKRFKRGAAEFDFAWEANLLYLQQDLVSGEYQPGRYRHFYIHDPKKRKISAAPFRDRIVHHAIVRILEPIYERRFIHDSYACRRGKGTHRALDCAQYYLRRHAFYLKTDIVRFFPNVDHEVLLQLLGRTIRDPRMMNLLTTIIASGRGILEDEATPTFFPGDDLFALCRPRGLPIGNLTSQFFANVLLDPVDHFIKEHLQVPGYVRYADDLVLFADSKSQLWDIRARLEQRLADLRLRLHEKKTQVRPYQSGLNFLGLRLFRSGRRLQQTILRRFTRRRRQLQWQFAHRAVCHRKVQLAIKGWLAYACQANSRGIRRDLWRGLRFRRR